ncbi:hypothetical protein [Marinicella marina]|uniref:hypothetical protein n=1 Tax=Marinicella marina TaxID=2996016 RepID=UPI0024BCBC69|nr:hypothetical protein [Marinicella marina]MDJ1139610.1 hypothetical protein [Marinicella marina]
MSEVEAWCVKDTFDNELMPETTNDIPTLVKNTCMDLNQEVDGRFQVVPVKISEVPSE